MDSRANVSQPLQDDGTIDIIGKRRDGGIELVVVASGALDGSVNTQGLLKRKLQAYIDAIGSREFRDEFGHLSPERVSIIVSCTQSPSSEIFGLIEKLAPFFNEQGATLRIEVKGKVV